MTMYIFWVQFVCWVHKICICTVMHIQCGCWH